MKKFLTLFITTAAIFGCATPSTRTAPPKRLPWSQSLELDLKSIEKSNPDAAIGVYIKNVQSGRELSFHGDKIWYIASAIKVPVAIEIFRAIDEGRLKLDTKTEVLSTDYIDGAGELNYIKPGSHVSVRMLLDQALTFSDNTATDILIRLAGIDKINALVNEFSPGGFTPITSLVEVRRQIFGAIHPNARYLKNMDYVRLKTIPTNEAKLKYLAQLLKVKPSQLKYDNFDSAYEDYYATQLNSATLRGYAALLEKVLAGEVLKPQSQKRLLNLLENIETGKDRLRAGFADGFVFSHKTGTQHRRICDMGILTPNHANQKAIVVACVRNLPLENAEQVLRNVGKAIRRAGVFSWEAQ